MSSADLRLLARGLKALAGELPNSLEHEVTVALTMEETLIEQGRRCLVVCVADGLRRVQGATPRKHTQASEGALLSLIEKLIAPVDRRSKCLLTARQVAGTGGEEGKPSVGSGKKVGCREKFFPGCRELERERKEIESATDRQDCFPFVLELEGRHDRSRPVKEERHRILLGERRHRVLVLADK